MRDTIVKFSNAFRSYKIWLLAALAAVSLYFAAYPFIRTHFTPSFIEVAQLQRTTGEIQTSSWCVPFDGRYYFDVAFQVSSKEQGATLLTLLGSGSYTGPGRYKISQKGVDIPIQIKVSDAETRIELDTSEAYPTVSRHSRNYVSRMIGKLNISHGCYQALISVGELPSSLQAYPATVRINIEKPTGMIGRAAFTVFGYSDWLVAILYSIHLRSILWASFVFFVLMIIVTVRREMSNRN